LFQYINGLEERIDFSEIGMEVSREQTIYVSGILISLEEDKNPIFEIKQETPISKRNSSPTNSKRT
jgi:hypothetical protein